MTTISPVPHQEPSQPAERERSAGEVVFDRTVYTGIGFFLNEGLSLWITDQFMHGKNLLAKVPGLHKAGEWFSQRGYERASEAIARVFNVGSVLGRNGQVISPKARAGNSLLMLMLISGGTLLLWPMKKLEDSKAYWVTKANHLVDQWRGSTMSPEEVAARDARVEKEINEAPHQSWASMLIGRTIAVFTSWSTGTFLMGPERNDHLMDWSEKLVAGSVQPEGQKTALNRYARLASVETYSCAISSVVLEIMSKLFAKSGWFERKKKSVPAMPSDSSPIPVFTATNHHSAAENSPSRSSASGFVAKLETQKEAAPSVLSTL